MHQETSGAAYHSRLPMRDVRRVLQVVGALALSGVNPVRGKSQLVMEKTFFLATSICEGLSCRKQIVGANEAFGIAGYRDCTKGETYGVSGEPPNMNLFELVYSCREAGENGYEIESKEACGITSVCLDASTTPELSEITYQIAFEFAPAPFLDHDVIVDVKFYFNYMEANETYYDLKSSVPVRCQLDEFCHRNCIAGEELFLATLEDEMGDGWNGGRINTFDMLHVEPQEVLEHSESYKNISVDTMLRERFGASYTNTLPGGYNRSIPICMADGEYMLSVIPPVASYDCADCGSSGSESSWNVCGHTGGFSDSALLLVQGAVCMVIESSYPTPQPSVEMTQPPTIDNKTMLILDDDVPNDFESELEDSMKHWQVFLLGVLAAALVAVAAVVGTQASGWFHKNDADATNDEEQDVARENTDTDEFVFT